MPEDPQSEKYVSWLDCRVSGAGLSKVRWSLAVEGLGFGGDGVGLQGWTLSSGNKV